MAFSKKILKTFTFHTIGERARPKISVSFNSPIFLLSKIGSYSREGNKSLYLFSQNLPGQVEQISLITTGTTKLHRYYWVTLNFLSFHQDIF